MGENSSAKITNERREQYDEGSFVKMSDKGEVFNAQVFAGGVRSVSRAWRGDSSEGDGSRQPAVS